MGSTVDVTFIREGTGRAPEDGDVDEGKNEIYGLSLVTLTKGETLGLVCVTFGVTLEVNIVMFLDDANERVLVCVTDDSNTAVPLLEKIHVVLLPAVTERIVYAVEVTCVTSDAGTEDSVTPVTLTNRDTLGLVCVTFGVTLEVNIVMFLDDANECVLELVRLVCVTDDSNTTVLLLEKIDVVLLPGVTERVVYAVEMICVTSDAGTDAVIIAVPLDLTKDVLFLSVTVDLILNVLFKMSAVLCLWNEKVLTSVFLGAMLDVAFVDLTNEFADKAVVPGVTLAVSLGVTETKHWKTKRIITTEYYGSGLPSCNSSMQCALRYPSARQLFFSELRWLLSQPIINCCYFQLTYTP